MPHYTVYETTNLLNGKTYIGKHITNDPEDAYLGSGKLLRRAIEKYSRDVFQKTVLFDFDNEVDMNKKESQLVTEEYCALPSNYNLCRGGQGGFGYINQHGLANKSKERYHTQAHLERWEKRRRPMDKEISRLGNEAMLTKYPKSPFYGRTHSEEAKAKISKSMSDMTGSKNSQYGSIWINDGITSKKLPKDTPIPVGWSKGRKRSQLNSN
jgi:hypothetical protein